MPAVSETVSRIRLLMVEDLRTDAELEIRELRRAGVSVEHRLVDREEEFLAALGNFAPDVILSDFSMPHFDGMAALSLARERAPDVPFIFVSGTIGEEYAIRALKNGATDYVLKTNLVRLPAAVERALHDARERRARRSAERKLAETHERLQSLYETLPDVVWSVELPRQRLAYISPAASAVYGYSPEEFMANQELRREIVLAEDRPAMLTAWRELLGGAHLNAEYRILGGDGSVRWIHDRARLIRDAAGAPVRVDGIARDISEAVRQRERLARLGRVRALIGAVNSAIVRLRNKQDLCDAFCRAAVEQGGFLAASVFEVAERGRVLRIVAQLGEKAGAVDAIVDEYNRDPGRATSRLAGALRSGRPVVSNDAFADERALRRDWYAQAGIKSLARLPMMAGDTPHGAVVLYSDERDFFDEEELLLLGELTGNLSFAFELIEKQEQVEYLALYDPLTGLPNRTLFQDRLTQAIEGSRRTSSLLSLTIFDIERFKWINDAYGQGAGDQVLREAARRLREVIGDVNRVARLSGDLFAVMRPGIQDPSEPARMLQERFDNVLGAPFLVDGRELKISAKAGIALFPDDGNDADALFRNAEASLKRAKETGERYLFYAPHINARVAEQVDLEHRLRKAVERGEIFLHFQPKVELESRRIVGLEALMRWRGPDNLLMSPARFVPVLEETGLILEAGRNAIELAARTWREWKAAGLNPPRIAVNVSALQLREKNFVEDVQAALGGPDNGVDLEITESLLMQDIEASIRKLRTLREAGASIALDDFGTGHSSLAYLSRLPIDAVKIDRSFIRTMTESADATSIVSTIISLAQALRLKVVAEGVEDEGQARLLRLLRCDQMQGYLFSPPQAHEKIEAMLRAAGV